MWNWVYFLPNVCWYNPIKYNDHEHFFRLCFLFARSCLWNCQTACNCMCTMPGYPVNATTWNPCWIVNSLSQQTWNRAGISAGHKSWEKILPQNIAWILNCWSTNQFVLNKIFILLLCYHMSLYLILRDHIQKKSVFLLDNVQKGGRFNRNPKVLR